MPNPGGADYRVQLTPHDFRLHVLSRRLPQAPRHDLSSLGRVATRDAAIDPTRPPTTSVKWTGRGAAGKTRPSRRPGLHHSFRPAHRRRANYGRGGVHRARRLRPSTASTTSPSLRSYRPVTNPFRDVLRAVLSLVNVFRLKSLWVISPGQYRGPDVIRGRERVLTDTDSLGGGDHSLSVLG